MEKQLKQRILNERLSQISLAESIEVSPTKPIIKMKKQHPLHTIKKILLAALIICFIFYRVGFESSLTACLVDRTHQITQYLNTLANESPLFYNIISIISQEAIQLQILIMGILAIMRFKNMSVHMFVSIFYGVRALHLHIEKLPFPQGIVSYAPVVPCFSVPYGITRDFFYSGHTGIMLFSLLLWKKIKYRKMQLLTYPLLAIVVIVLLITRVHYIVDVIGGAVFALWIDRFLLPKVIWFDYAFTCIYKVLMQGYALVRGRIN